MIYPRQIYEYTRNRALVVQSIDNNNIFCSVIPIKYINESFVIIEKFVTIKRDKFFYNLIKDSNIGYCDQSFIK